jgi:type IV secretory pathway VirB2 component (pilin)
MRQAASISTHSERELRSFKEGHLMIVRRIYSRKVRTALLVLLSLQLPATAFAAPAGGGLPWESPITKIQESLQGLGTPLAIIAVIVAGFAIMFGESGGLSRKAVGIVVGASLVFGAAGAISSLFEGASGVLF